MTLRDDVIEGSPHPKLNGHQQGTPGGACSAKGLGTFAQRAGGCSLGWGVAQKYVQNNLTEPPPPKGYGTCRISLYAVSAGSNRTSTRSHVCCASFGVDNNMYNRDCQLDRVNAAVGTRIFPKSTAEGPNSWVPPGSWAILGGADTS